MQNFCDRESSEVFNMQCIVFVVNWFPVAVSKNNLHI